MKKIANTFWLVCLLAGGFHLKAQAQLTCSFDVKVLPDYDLLSVIELPDSALLATYQGIFPAQSITRMIYNKEGVLADSFSFPYNGKPFFTQKGTVYIVNGIALTKLDLHGNTIWTRESSALTDCLVSGLIELENGCPILVGQRDVQIFFKSTIMKFSPSGDYLWQKDYNYSGPSFESVFEAPSDTALYATLHYFNSAIVFKLDTLGNEVWSKQVGPKSSDIYGHQFLPNGDLLLTVRWVNQPELHIACYLVELGPGGVIVKNKEAEGYLPDTQSSEINTIGKLIKTADQAYAFSYVRTYPGPTYQEVLVKLDENLDSLCTETYTKVFDLMEFTFSGGLGQFENAGNGFKVTKGLVVCGPDLCATLETPPTPAPADTEWAVFPNPAHQRLNITWTGRPEGRLLLVNALGQEVFSAASLAPTMEIGVSHFPTGLYTLILQPVNGKPKLQKVVVAPQVRH